MTRSRPWVVLGGDVDLGAITFPSATGDDAARATALAWMRGTSPTSRHSRLCWV